MAGNRFLSELSEQGLRTQDLLDDRIPPGDGWVWLPPHSFLTNATSVSVSGNGMYWPKFASAGATTFLATNVLKILGRLSPGRGVRVTKVAVAYKLSATATTADIILTRVTYANGSAPSGANVTYTLDAAHDTAGERAASGEHVMVASIDNPQYETTDLTPLSIDFQVGSPGGVDLYLYGCAVYFEHNYL